jgi:TolB-like protein/DNA-binding winged helix-turn-helix (wHTH) protein/Tfp pilus assembly protein PilF
MAAREILRFAAFELNLQAHELLSNGRPVKVSPQALRLLEFLATRPGRLLTREEIRQEIWSETTFVDFEQGINKSIRQIRDALNDDAERPRFVETLPRRGYRFIANVEYSENHSTTVPAGDSTHVAFMIAPITKNGGEFSKAEAASGTGVVRESAWSVRRWLMIAAAVIVLVAIAGLAKMGLGWNHGVRSIRSLAVLPVENLSHDPEQEYFADGMTDDLITDLAKISALRVVSRTSVMQYKGTKKSAPEIARELKVDAVLEGTVARYQDRVRITAQLISADPEKHLWAEKYETSLSDVLTAQDDVAKAVARAIQIEVKPAEQLQLATPHAVNPEAYEAYLRGRYWANLPTEQNLSRSREYFEQAIQKDPGYALAWAGLANAYEYLSNWGVLPSQDALPRARAAAEKALELDNNLVSPLVTLAVVKMNYEWDWAGSESLAKRAIELSPNDGEARHIYATYLAEVGRTEEAVAEARKARELEPLSIVYVANVVWKLYLARKYDEAESECRRIIEWYPKFNGSYPLASVYLQTGRQHETVAILQKSVAVSNHSVLESMYLGHALGVTGDRTGGHQVLQELLQMSQRRNVPPEYIAIVYEGLGERDHALQWFETAYKERSMNGWILPDQRLDSIRLDPRFQDILRRMGLPQIKP